jgi:(S)-3,5-dihydroxyphenylglycine transaminase
MNRGDSAPAPASALTLGDYARLARESMDAGVWDFIAGGAGEERTLAANIEAFDRVWLRPRVLAGAGQPSTATQVLGRTWTAPVAIAPMAYHTLVHPEGELATARAAGPAGLPFVVSTFAGRTFEDIASAAGSPQLWLQVYCFRDRCVTQRLIERAKRAGFEALVLTVDAPYMGRRLRDLRNGFRLPPGIEPANLTGSGSSSPTDHALVEFDQSLDWSVVDWLRSVCSLPLLLKGIMTGPDARRATEAGADGIVVSNHGGRQLDGVPAALEMLPEVVAAVAGSCPVFLGGGIRRGLDVLASLALGADAVLLGRPVLNGLAAAGCEGVARVLGIVIDELTDAMTLTGTGSVADVGSHLVQGPGVRLRHPTGTVPVIAGAAISTVLDRRRLAPLPAQPPPDASDVRKEDLHVSVSDPVLDTMNFLNEITLRYPGAISFAPGRPYEGFFDTEQIFTHLRRYIDYLGETGNSPGQIRNALFQYGPTAGRIRELIASSLREDENIDVPPESIVVTVGCQEAMFLTMRALISGRQDVLLVSSPCYVGITGAARLLDIELVAVEEREEGLCCADLEAAILAERARGRRPRACYVVPDHSNPSGTTMPAETRHALLDLAGHHDLLVLEDSPYRPVSPGPRLPAIKSLDRQRRVVHLGSFAKSVFPGARVGFAIADQVVVDSAGRTGLLADELAKIKSMVTVNTSPLSQAVVAGMLLSCGGRISDFNTTTAAYYGNAMRATLQQLDKCFPAAQRAALGVRWNSPSGGFFLTMHVPFRADNAALARSAQDFGVIWTPMSYFYPLGGGDYSIRLSISYLSQAELAEGISRLTSFIEAEACVSPAPRGDAAVPVQR